MQVMGFEARPSSSWSSGVRCSITCHGLLQSANDIRNTLYHSDKSDFAGSVATGHNIQRMVLFVTCSLEHRALGISKRPTYNRLWYEYWFGSIARCVTEALLSLLGS